MISRGAVRRIRLLATTAALMLASVAGTAVARADPPSREAVAAAEAAFDEGKRLAASGRYPEACGKFEESQRLAPGSGTLLNLADCYEHVGRTASAWGTFRDAAAAARANGNAARDKEARSRAAALEPRLSKLKVVVPDEARVPGLSVRRGEVSVGESLWGMPVPVDPGDVAVTSSAPSHVDWSGRVTVPREPGVVEITLPKLQPAPTAAPKPTAAPSPQPDARSEGGTQRTVAAVVAGVGLVALGVGTGFGIDAISKKDASNEEGGCRPDNLCPPRGIELRDQAVAEAHVATTLFVVGGLALAGGAVLWLTAPSSGPDVAVVVSPRAAALRFVGW